MRSGLRVTTGLISSTLCRCRSVCLLIVGRGLRVIVEHKRYSFSEYETSFHDTMFHQMHTAAYNVPDVTNAGILIDVAILMICLVSNNASAMDGEMSE